MRMDIQTDRQIITGILASYSIKHAKEEYVSKLDRLEYDKSDEENRK